ncbi:MAG: hypothetical protein QY318_02315 [Candidatus Dojkabacteria bacterium]|nr:MAG: hypothetical protein QY318_02315 [Candidatus Dojkabacteria bacterium]
MGDEQSFLKSALPKNPADEVLWALRLELVGHQCYEHLLSDGDAALMFCIWQIKNENLVINNLGFRAECIDPDTVQANDAFSVWMSFPHFAEQVEDAKRIIGECGLHHLLPGQFDKQRFEEERIRFTHWLKVQEFALANPCQPLSPDELSLYQDIIKELDRYTGAVFVQLFWLYLRLLTIPAEDHSGYKYDHYTITS